MLVHSQLVEGVYLRRLGGSASGNDFLCDHFDGRPVAPGKKKFGSFASKGARDSATYSASGSINYSDLVLQQHTNFLRSRLDKNTTVYLYFTSEKDSLLGYGNQEKAPVALSG